MTEIFKRAAELLTKKDKIIIAIDGQCCAGKSEMARFMAENLDCNVFHLDDFFLTEEERQNKSRGFVNADVSRFRAEVLEKLSGTAPFDYEKYDCESGTVSKFVVTEQKPLNIVEGAYCLCDELAGYYDIKIFLKIDEAEQLSRLKKREADITPYIEKWIPLENDYIAAQRPQDKADFVGRISADGEFIKTL